MSCVVDFTEHLMMLRNHLLMNVALGCYKWVDWIIWISLDGVRYIEQLMVLIRVDSREKSNLLRDLPLFPHGVAVIESTELLRLFQTDNKVANVVNKENLLHRLELGQHHFFFTFTFTTTTKRL